MKKLNILYLSLGIIPVVLVIIFLSTNIFNNKINNVVSNNINKKVYSSSLAMMLETSYASGEYKESTDTTWMQAINKGYKFNETLSKCENGSTLAWDETNQTVVFSGDVSDKCYVYFDVKPTFANVIISLYTTDGENGLYYHDGTGTYGEYEAEDYSYRYSGADPDNYVCFGTDDETCPTDNLYRIIGVFDGRVKLIKYDYATSDVLGTDGAYYNTCSGTGWSTLYYKGSNSASDIGVYYWDSSNSISPWKLAELNTIHLNTNFCAWLGSTWQNYIDDTTWQVGGNTWESIGTTAGAKNVYTCEITNPAYSTTYTSKIGLMYVSEYMYAADPTQADSWNSLMGYTGSSSLSFGAVTMYNWIYMGIYEWTITAANFMNQNVPLDIDLSGQVNVKIVQGDDASMARSVRPTFNLKSSVELKSGSGTASDPYRISI